MNDITDWIRLLSSVCLFGMIGCCVWIARLRRRRHAILDEARRLEEQLYNLTKGRQS